MLRRRPGRSIGIWQMAIGRFQMADGRFEISGLRFRRRRIAEYGRLEVFPELAGEASARFCCPDRFPTACVNRRCPAMGVRRTGEGMICGRATLKRKPGDGFFGRKPAPARE